MAGIRDGEDRPDTLIVRAGRRPEWTAGVVNPPVVRASTILFDSVAAMRAAWPPRDGRLHYGRSGTPTQWALAEALTGLEPGAAATKLYPSGSAAVAAALLSVLSAGDRLLMTDSAYGPTRYLCDSLLARMGVETVYYDPLIAPDDLAALAAPGTKAIFMESPGSLTFEVQDVPGLCGAAKALGLVTLLDNTWATPLLFPAMAAGVDLAILACTKYVVGHSDAMLGSVTATAPFAEGLEQAGRALGQAAAPDDCYLAQRGLRTMAVRLRQHEASALAVARWLEARREVLAVLHPAFADCPGHDLWKRDFKGSSGLFSIRLACDAAARDRFVDALRLFGIGYSWGGYESLAVPADPGTLRTATRAEGEGSLVRLHIGLEDPDDLIADLDRAFALLEG